MQDILTSPARVPVIGEAPSDSAVERALEHLSRTRLAFRLGYAIADSAVAALAGIEFLSRPGFAPGFRELTLRVASTVIHRVDARLAFRERGGALLAQAALVSAEARRRLTAES